MGFTEARIRERRSQGTQTLGASTWVIHVSRKLRGSLYRATTSGGMFGDSHLTISHPGMRANDPEDGLMCRLIF